MDDEDMIRKTACRMFSQLGYEADTAGNGEEAIAAFLQARSAGKPYDLLIMDLTVPGRMGGKDALQKILKIDPQARALASSGYSNDPVMQAFENYGFCGIVVKPYRLIDLKEAVRKAMA
jgi:two-component system cell cycle sensor histidine kinase/response regulator CckA